MSGDNEVDRRWFWAAAIITPFAFAYGTDGLSCIEASDGTIGDCSLAIDGPLGFSTGFILGCFVSVTIILAGLKRWLWLKVAAAPTICFTFSYLYGSTKTASKDGVIAKHHSLSTGWLFITFVSLAITALLAILFYSFTRYKGKPRPCKPDKERYEDNHSYAVRVKTWEFELTDWAEQNPDRHNGQWPYFEIGKRRNPDEAYRHHLKKEKPKDSCRTCGGTGKCPVCGFDHQYTLCKACGSSRDCYSCNGDGQNHCKPFDP